MLPQSHESISPLPAETQVERESSQTANLSPCMLLLYSYDFGARFKPSPFAPTSVKKEEALIYELSLDSPRPQQESSFSQTLTSLLVYQSENDIISRRTTEKQARSNEGDNFLGVKMESTSLIIPPNKRRKGILKLDGKYNTSSQKQRTFY